MAKRNIFVVGGSAGSSAPLKTLISGLPRDFPGSVFITTHIPSTHASYLPAMLAQMPRAGGADVLICTPPFCGWPQAANESPEGDVNRHGEDH